LTKEVPGVKLEYMEKNILIIGARGMLGCDLMKVFQGLNPLGIDKEELDITSKEAVENFILELKPILVINAAAYTDVGGCEQNQDLAMRVNGDAVGYLAKAAEKIGATLVHYSTDYVFDGKSPEGHKEDNEPKNPINFYGKSKLFGEKLLKENCRNYYLIRTSWLFGRHGKNFVDTILKLGKEKEELKVVNDQHGKPTYTMDLAKRTKELLDGKSPFGVYHITNEGITSWYDYALKIFEIYKQLNPGQKLAKVVPCASAEYLRFTRRSFVKQNFCGSAKRPIWSILLNTKLPSSRPWEEALRDYLKNDKK